MINLDLYKSSILDLIRHLDILEVPHGDLELMQTESRSPRGYQIHFPWTAGDVACNIFTYHNEDGFVESYHFKFDRDDVTARSPSDMAALIKAEYIEYCLDPENYYDEIEEDYEE